jgi:hypothetical protein
MLLLRLESGPELVVALEEAGIPTPVPDLDLTDRLT